jgi:hypothetical protein
LAVSEWLMKWRAERIVPQEMGVLFAPRPRCIALVGPRVREAPFKVLDDDRPGFDQPLGTSPRISIFESLC